MSDENNEQPRSFSRSLKKMKEADSSEKSGFTAIWSKAKNKAKKLIPQNSSIGVGAIPVPSLNEIEDTVEPGFTYTREEKIKSIENINANRSKKFKTRAVADVFRNCLTYILSCICLVVLIAIVVYCFTTGWSTFSWSFITGNYESTTYNVMTAEGFVQPEGDNFEVPSLDDGEYFSSRWGVAFQDGTKTDGSKDMVISYVANDSPFTRLVDNTGSLVDVTTGFTVSNLSGYDANGILVTVSVQMGAKKSAQNLDKIGSIIVGNISSGGFGIRGPLIATLWMILFSLIIALPLGIGGAVYLSYYAKSGPVTKLLQSLIDMISGVPSIIFGLAGAIIFIPVFNWTGNTGNILSGSATLACMVLPTIMKSTQEAIKSIPKSLKNASLALGASQTQTVFKVIIPNTVPGILTGTLLAIGRIIGESAALVFATGTYISDAPVPTGQAASLAVYIWKVMNGENPNYKSAAAAAMLILIVVLILNIIIKLLAAKFNKFRPIGPTPWYKKLYNKAKKRFEEKKEIRAAITASDKTGEAK